MNKKQLIVLGSITAFFGVIAFFQTDFKSEEASQSLLFPELQNQLAEVQTIKIFPSVTLIKQQEKWVVQEKYNFAADTQKINRWLLALAESTLVEEKTSRRENYTKLGIEKGTPIEVLGQGNTVLASLVIGETRPGSIGGTFVRKSTEKKVWLVSGDLFIYPDATHWIKKEQSEQLHYDHAHAH